MVGARQAFENNSFRGVMGVRGAISENWDYDASVQYSKVKADQTTNNYFHTTRLTRAMDAVTDPRDGSARCRRLYRRLQPRR